MISWEQQSPNPVLDRFGASERRATGWRKPEMQKPVVVRETRDERVVRLARVARERGIKVYQEQSTGCWFATSASQPGKAHYVTGVSCACEGFVHTGACTHNAALLDSLGWLPAVEPAPATMPCLACRGAGELWSQGSWTADRCEFCSGRGCVDVVVDRVPTNVIEFPRSDSPRDAA